MDLVEEIKKIAEGKLTDKSQFIVDVVISSRKGPKKVLILLDGDQGITIDDCAELSRELSKTLDELKELEESYMLEVSTPGVDHPLVLHRQFKKNIGRGLKVKLQDKILEGNLTEVFEQKIILTQKNGLGKKKEVQTIEIPFSEIEKAFVLVSFK
jgi:ribosome maturation factor RimP